MAKLWSIRKASMIGAGVGALGSGLVILLIGQRSVGGDIDALGALAGVCGGAAAGAVAGFVRNAIFHHSRP